MNVQESTVKVSIVIPVYNAQNYLSGCLDSLVKQTLTDIEIICIDDGSTDHSLEILKRYAEKDNRITVIEQKNSGAGAARNVGISCSKGQYIGFVDSDDTVDKEMFSKLYSQAVKDNSDMVINGQVKLSTHKIHYFTDAGTLYLMEEKPFTIRDFPVILNSCFLWNRIFRRNFILGNHFFIPENRKFAEDLLFCTQTSVCAKSISCISEPYYTYNIHQGSLTDTLNKSRDKSDYIIAISETKDFLLSKDVYSYCKKDFLTFCMNIAYPLLNSLKRRTDSKRFFEGLSEILDEDDLETIKDTEIGKAFPHITKSLSLNEWHYFWKERG